MGNNDPKRVFTSGLTDPRPTQPPEDFRHPGCEACRGEPFRLARDPSRFEPVEMLVIDSTLKGREVLFLCHGRRDMTEVKRIQLLIRDISESAVRPDGEGEPSDPPPKTAEIQWIVGLEEWKDRNVTFTTVRGTVEGGRDLFIDGSPVSTLLAPGRFLVLRDERNCDFMIQVPIVHMAVRRGGPRP
jgi:hypothetical protein